MRIPRLRLAALLGLLLAGLFSPEARGAEREVLIWGGSRKRKEAAALLEALQASPSQLPRGLKLAPGFPKLIDSRTLQGLNPGFHVVLLGFCFKTEVQEVLAELKAVNPGVYTRTVTVPSGKYDTACPTRAAPGPVREDPGREELLEALEAVERREGRERQVKLLERSPFDPRTGQLAALVEVGAEERLELVELVQGSQGPKVLGRTALPAGSELWDELMYLSPRGDVAVGVLHAFGEDEKDETEEGEPRPTTRGSRMTVYLLTPQGPRSVLDFELESVRGNVECDTRRKVEAFGPVKVELSEGYYPFQVVTVTDDSVCARAYQGASGEDEGPPPEDLGITRDRKLYRWSGSSYR
jgi:hypothetical protein